MFSEERVAQMAAYLLSKGGGRMAYLKLMKLLYLSDRESMRRFGETISGDRMVSMPHGPVLSQTLDLINGFIQGNPNGWDKWISDKESYDVSLKQNPVGRDDFDELSDDELGILDGIHAEFGHMNKYEIRDYTHKNCTEWSDPHGGSHTINAENVFIALGKSYSAARVLADRLRDQQQLDEMVRSLI